MSDDAKARSSAASLPEAKFKVDDPVLMTTQRGIGRVASVLAPVAFPGLRNVRYGVLLPNLDPEPCLFEEHELTGVTGRWVHCSPELLASGVDCGTTPRSVCRCPFDGSHDHLVSEERADRPASAQRHAGCVSRASDTCVYLSDGTKVVVRRDGQRAWLECVAQETIRALGETNPAPSETARPTSAQAGDDAPKRCEKEALVCHFREKKLVESVERLKKRLDTVKAERSEAAHQVVQKLLTTMYLYNGYPVMSRGPVGLLIDAIELLEPETAAKIKAGKAGENWELLVDPDPEDAERPEQAKEKP